MFMMHVSSAHHATNGSLVDDGANAGVAGDDIHVTETSAITVDVHGIDDHTLMNIPMVTAGGVAKSQKGNVIVILHQYAYTGHGSTIHLLPQIEQHYGNNINDRSVHFPNGLQWITTICSSHQHH